MSLLRTPGQDVALPETTLRSFRGCTDARG